MQRFGGPQARTDPLDLEQESGNRGQGGPCHPSQYPKGEGVSYFKVGGLEAKKISMDKKK